MRKKIYLKYKRKTKGDGRWKGTTIVGKGRGSQWARGNVQEQKRVFGGRYDQNTVYICMKLSKNKQCNSYSWLLT